jgi:hypothetical protein
MPRTSSDFTASRTGIATDAKLTGEIAFRGSGSPGFRLLRMTYPLISS